MADAQTEKKFTVRAESLHGIIHYLTRKVGGDLVGKGAVGVLSSATSNADPRNAARNIADLTADSCFRSAFRPRSTDIGPGPNNWVGYDFKDKTVAVAGYSVRTFFNSYVNGPNPKSWVVEVSPDGDTWTEIDRQVDSAALNRKNAVVTFATTANPRARFVRFVNLGRNWMGNDGLCISGFEIFGSLWDSSVATEDDFNTSDDELALQLQQEYEDGAMPQ